MRINVSCRAQVGVPEQLLYEFQFALANKFASILVSMFGLPNVQEPLFSFRVSTLLASPWVYSEFVIDSHRFFHL